MRLFSAAIALSVVAVASPARAQSSSKSFSASLGAEARYLESATVCEAGSFGCYREADGSWRRTDTVYRLRLDDADPQYLRASLEMLGLLAAGTLWYAVQYEDESVDWTRQGWRQRFDRRSYRYDNNPFAINFAGHALSGSAYYGLARVNDLSVPAAAFVAFMTSWVWEFFLEFRGAVSMNDQLLTPMAGIAIGEFFHRLAQYANSAPGGGGPGHKAAQWTAGLPLSLHRALDGAPPPSPDSPADDHGFGAELAADLRLGYVTSLAKPDEGSSFVTHGLRFDGSFAAIPGFLREGRFAGPFADADVTSFALQFDAAPEGSAVQLDARTILAGGHAQSLYAEPDGLRGGAVTVGPSVSYSYQREQWEDFTDQLGLVGLPGLSLLGHALAGPVGLRLRVDANPQFAGVRSSIYPEWEQDNDDEDVEKVLREQGYYYGWGGQVGGLLELRLPHLRLGASASYGSWVSHSGFGRSDDGSTMQLETRDQSIDYAAWLRLLPFDSRAPLFLEWALQGHTRRSSLASRSTTRTLRRYQLRLGFAL